MKTPKVDICIPTRNRYDHLAVLLNSISVQTYPNFDVVILDDSDTPLNLMQIPCIAPTLNLLVNAKHDWKVFFGQKKGPHFAHKCLLEEAKSNYILRVDDDCVLAPTCLEELMKTMMTEENCAGVAPIILNPNFSLDTQQLGEGWETNKAFTPSPHLSCKTIFEATSERTEPKASE